MKTHATRRRWAGMALLAALVSSAASANSDWFTRVWQSGDGLPNHNVTALAQTPDGYLWVAAMTRMVRFDGIHFAGLFSDLAASGCRQRASAVLWTHDNSTTPSPRLRRMVEPRGFEPLTS